MLTITNHEQLTPKPLDLPVPRYVLNERPITEQDKQKPEFELTSLNPK
jgi:hypothetical protein